MATYQIKVKAINKVLHIASDKDFLDVELEITKCDMTEENVLTQEVVSVQKHAFDPMITKENLLAEIEKIRAGWEAEQKQKALNAKDEAVNKHVEELQALVESEETNEEQKNNDNETKN